MINDKNSWAKYELSKRMNNTSSIGCSLDGNLMKDYKKAISGSGLGKSKRIKPVKLSDRSIGDAEIMGTSCHLLNRFSKLMKFFISTTDVNMKPFYFIALVPDGNFNHLYPIMGKDNQSFIRPLYRQTVCAKSFLTFLPSKEHHFVLDVKYFPSFILPLLPRQAMIIKYDTEDSPSNMDMAHVLVNGPFTSVMAEIQVDKNGFFCFNPESESNKDVLDDVRNPYYKFIPSYKRDQGAIQVKKFVQEWGNRQ